MRNVSYQYALQNDGARQDYAKLFEKGKPPYVQSIDYATGADIAELMQQSHIPIGLLELFFPPDAVAKALALDPEKLGKGTYSRVLILPGSFSDDYKVVDEDQKNDLGLIIANAIKKHEFIHAAHYFRGFREYPLENFTDANGDFNIFLFNAVTEIQAHLSEHKGLKGEARKARSGLFDLYRDNLPNEAQMYYNWLLDPEIVGNMNPEFIDRLRKELNPKALFK